MGRPPIKNTPAYKLRLKSAERDYRKGKSIHAIAATSGLSRKSISEHLKSIGFKIKPGVEPKDTEFIGKQ